MKIGIALPSLGFRGGLERYGFEVASSLAREGHQVVLYHGDERGRDPHAFSSPFSAVVPWARANQAPEVDVVFVQKASRLEELAIFEDTPVVLAAHDHDLTCARSHRYLLGTSQPCHRAPGLACVAHGCVAVRRDGPIPIRLVNPLALRTRLLALAARARIVACSDYVSARLQEAGVRADRVVTVHPVLPWERSPLVRRPRERRLLATGQLLRGKGFDLAIRALRDLPSDVVLEVAGDGPQRGELEALAASCAPGRVHFTGYVRPADMNATYDRASVVLVPSRWPEPFGMVGLEAMRRARPVVGARHGGIPEWLSPDAGRLVAPLDPSELARAALDLLEDADAGDRALRAAERFRHEDMIERLVRVLAASRAA